MKRTAVFARLNVLLSGVVLVQEDGWVAAKMKRHMQPISSLAATSLMCSLSKLFTTSLQRSPTMRDAPLGILTIPVI